MKYRLIKKRLSADGQVKKIMGNRSNGKTYTMKKYCIEQYYRTRKTPTIIHRFSEEFTENRSKAMFAPLVSNGEIASITGGEWTGVHFCGGCWYLCRYEDDTMVTDETPFAYSMNLSYEAIEPNLNIKEI